MDLFITITANGTERTLELQDPRVTLLDLLRERLDLTGAKKGEIGTAGAIANAVWHATGVRVRRFPIALEGLLEVVS